MHESTPPKTTPPQPPPSADEVRARLAEVEAEVERATLAMARLWAQIVDMKKEV